MYLKLSILLLFTAVAQSSLALYTSGSCAPMTKIGADLSTIKYAEDTERSGYLRFAQVIYSEVMNVLAERYGEIHTDPEDADSRAKLALNESFTGPVNGVLPNCEAIRIIQPDLDIPTVVKIATAERLEVNRNVFMGIKAAQGRNHAKARANIAKYSKLARDGVVGAIKLFYSAMTNGSNSIPEEDKRAIACVQAKTESRIDAAIVAIFEEIHILQKALSEKSTKNCMEKYSSEFGAAHKKACDSFNAEISHKFSVLRNIAIAQYLQKTGTVTGLFAVQSTIAFA